MSHLKKHTKDLYELRFSPMCKPAAEVANLTQLESQTTRSRIMMLWRIVESYIDWTPRNVELIYESTLDSISEAFDVFHYPISQYMLAARADIWEADLAPETVRRSVATSASTEIVTPEASETMVLAGEIAQLDNQNLLSPIQDALEKCNIDASTWIAPTGALAYTLGAREVAREQAAKISAGINTCGAQTIIADGPETLWALTKIYPAQGVNLPKGVSVKLLSVVLDEQVAHSSNEQNLGTIMFHDSRPACLIADQMATYLAIMPGYLEDEKAFGAGAVYESPRRLLDALGAARVFGTWTRSLAKTSGADDGLWLTHPRLAAGLAGQRLDYAASLGAETIVTDSPLAASFLSQYASSRSISVRFLAELI